MLMRRTPLGRGKRLRPVNPKRRRERLAAAFGEQAQRCRESPCCVCGARPSDPHHDPARSLGGLDRDTLPLCRPHHDERHRIGRPAFEKKHGVDMLAEAERMRAA